MYLEVWDINRRASRGEGYKLSRINGERDINRRVSRREGNKQSCISGSEHYLSCISKSGI